jgi:hypothetical protein
MLNRKHVQVSNQMGTKLWMLSWDQVIRSLSTSICYHLLGRLSGMTRNTIKNSLSYELYDKR